MNRRGFLEACLAAATAPYVVTAAGVLMPVRPSVFEIRAAAAAALRRWAEETLAPEMDRLMAEQFCEGLKWTDAQIAAMSPGWRFAAEHNLILPARAT